MRNALIFLGGIIGGFLGLLAVLRDEKGFLAVAVLITALFSSFSRGKLAPFLGFAIFYLSWTASIFLTAYTFEPDAILSLFALVFYFPFIALGYALAVLILKKLAFPTIE